MQTQAFQRTRSRTPQAIHQAQATLPQARPSTPRHHHGLPLRPLMGHPLPADACVTVLFYLHGTVCPRSRAWLYPAHPVTAYVAGSLSNAKIMELMHMHDGEKRLAWRCIASTIVGETLDMTVFTLLAFTGVLPWPVIGQMIVVASAIKVAVECICYPLVTSHVIAWAKTLE
ncbi:MAG: VUT family protein [Atopobiaceae bacterium]